MDKTGQSTGGQFVFGYLIQPQEFTMLKTGGEESDLKVDGVIFQVGDKLLTQNFIRHEFPQVYPERES